MEKTKEKDLPISIRMPVELRKDLELMAEMQAQSISDLIICICQNYIKKNKTIVLTD